MTNNPMKTDHISYFVYSALPFFLLLPFVSQAQVNVEWSNYPGGVALATDQLHHVYSANWDYNPGGDITLTKRTSDGTIVWNTAFDNTDDTRHEVCTWVETDNQNNCLVAGTIRSGFSNPVDAASVLMKFDDDGNLLWRNVFESSFEGSYTRKIVVDDSDNVYVMGLGNGPDGLVTRVKKFDANGDAVWTYYDVNGIGAPMNFKFTPDNCLLLSGRGTTGTVNGYLKLSLAGDLIWSRSGVLSPTIGDASGDSFGNTYMVNGENVISNARSIVEKFDPDGILVWSDTASMAATKVETGSDNEPIISGFPNAGSAGAAFMKYDADGSVLWQNLNADGAEMLLLHGQLKLDAANNAYLSAGNLFNMAVCKINADGTYGWVGLVSGSNSTQSFTIDTDNSVYLTGGTTAKIGETITGVNGPDNAEYLVTPNPFHEQFTLTVKNDHSEKQISICSISGKTIYEASLKGQVTSIALPAMASGVYILNVVDHNGTSHQQKIIKN
jgi:hypothetical protein